MRQSDQCKDESVHRRLELIFCLVKIFAKRCITSEGHNKITLKIKRPLMRRSKGKEEINRPSQTVYDTSDLGESLLNI